MFKIAPELVRRFAHDVEIAAQTCGENEGGAVQVLYERMAATPDTPKTIECKGSN